MISLRYGLLCLLFSLGCSSEVTGPNMPPIAVAGPDRVAEVNHTLVLDGTGSYDPDGEPIKFVWELIAADPPQDDLVDLSGFREPKAQITVRAPGVWILRLQVNDGRLDSPPDIVRVTVSGRGPCEQDSECNDGNPCNGNETCVDEQCQPGIDLDCDDLNDCTDGVCDPATTCVFTNNSNDCIDGDPCTVSDACDQGECRGIIKTSLTLADGGCDDEVACTEDTCDPLDGACGHAPITGACDDGDPCTANDECNQDGNCTGEEKAGLPLDQGGCDTGDPCSDASCDPADGSCLYSQNSGPCDDGEACTKLDTCTEGVCVGSPYTCEDGNICNGTETCSPDDDTCLSGQNLPDTSFCLGNDLVICNGAGDQIGMTTCSLGCNPDVDPNRCRTEIVATFGENSSSNHTNDYQGVTEDVSVDGRNPQTNYDSGFDSDGHNVNHDRYLWIRFDISALPDDAQVQAVTLYLFSEWRWNEGWAEDQTYEVAAGAETTAALDWEEAEATWESYDGDDSWTGGEDGGALDRSVVLSSLTVPQWMVNDWSGWDFNPEGVAYAQGRLDGQVNLTVYGTIATYSRQYMASETEDLDNGDRPVLKINYVW